IVTLNILGVANKSEQQLAWGKLRAPAGFANPHFDSGWLRWVVELSDTDVVEISREFQGISGAMAEGNGRGSEMRRADRYLSFLDHTVHATGMPPAQIR